MSTQIVSLRAENFKRLKAVQITPEGNIVRITGPNASGKTSILDAIEAAIGGGKSQPEQPIRKGQRRSRIVLDLGELLIERRYTAKGTNLVVKGKDGTKYASPQKLLDTLYNRIALDPLAFMRMSPKEQRDTLADLLGLSGDLDALEKTRSDAYDRRRTLKYDLKQAEAELGSIPAIPEGVPREPLSIPELTERLQQAHATKAAQDRKVSELAGVSEDIRGLASTINSLRENLANAEERQEVLRKEAAKLAEMVDAFTEPPVEEMSRNLAEAEQVNRYVVNRSRAEALDGRIEGLRDQVDDLSQSIAEIEKRKSEIVENADFPVDGLGLADDVVLFRDIPLSQASCAEQAIVSTAISMEQHSDFAVTLLRDASVLDSESFAAVCDLSAQHGNQTWVEQVDEDGEIGIYIEEGEIVTIDGKEVEADRGPVSDPDDPDDPSGGPESASEALETSEVTNGEATAPEEDVPDWPEDLHVQEFPK